MKSEARTILAVVLSMGILFVWYTWINPPKPVDQKPTEITKVAEPEIIKKTKPSGQVLEKFSSKDPQRNLPIRDTKVTTKKFEVTFSNEGALPTSWKLLNYSHEEQENGHKKEIPIDLVFPKTKPLFFGFKQANFFWPEMPRFRLRSGGDDYLEYVWRSNEVEMIKKIKFDPETYQTKIVVSLKNLTGKTIMANPLWRWEGPINKEKKGGLFSFLMGPPDVWHPLYLQNNDVTRHENVDEMTNGASSGKIYWAGVENRYFLSSFIPELSQDQTVRWGKNSQEDGFFVELETKPVILPAGLTWKFPMTLYVGPKEIRSLKETGSRLEEAIDYGWFGFIALPTLHFLKFLHKIFGNYGIAIILLTILIKLALHPINKKSMESMKAMQNVQPQLKKLKEKYANDKQRLNMEMMNLFKNNKVNPMGGCLPMVAQFPIYIALYRVLWNSVELYQSPFLFYKDLSLPDPFMISPILLGIAMFLQQKLTPTATVDPVQKKMMTLMPLMFCGFMIFLPVGLTVYILVNTVMSVLQQWMMHKGIRLRDVVTGRAFAKAP